MTAAMRWATNFGFPAAARESALIAYGPDYVQIYRRAPFYVDRILNGTKPADLPVQQASKLVNLKTAKALGLEVPLSILIRADELIDLGFARLLPPHRPAPSRLENEGMAPTRPNNGIAEEQTTVRAGTILPSPERPAPPAIDARRDARFPTQDCALAGSAILSRSGSVLVSAEDNLAKLELVSRPATWNRLMAVGDARTRQ
jgi:hypothetical protein